MSIEVTQFTKIESKKKLHAGQWEIEVAPDIQSYSDVSVIDFGKCQ